MNGVVAVGKWVNSSERWRAGGNIVNKWNGSTARTHWTVGLRLNIQRSEPSQSLAHLSSLGEGAEGADTAVL